MATINAVIFMMIPPPRMSADGVLIGDDFP
jgi:hypothetical protein